MTGDILLVSDTRSCRGSLLDVSAGGVRVRVGDAPGEWGEVVLLKRNEGTDAAVRCHIVRVLPDLDGVELGLRFDRAQADGDEQLLELLG